MFLLVHIYLFIYLFIYLSLIRSSQNQANRLCIMLCATLLWKWLICFVVCLHDSVGVKAPVRYEIFSRVLIGRQYLFIIFTQTLIDKCKMNSTASRRSPRLFYCAIHLQNYELFSECLWSSISGDSWLEMRLYHRELIFVKRVRNKKDCGRRGGLRFWFGVYLATAITLTSISLVSIIFFVVLPAC